MRVAVLNSYHWWNRSIFIGLKRLGHEFMEFGYFRNYDTLVDRVIAIQPDWLLMIGMRDDGTDTIPPVSVLTQLTSRIPSILICQEGSERDWWSQLELYFREAGFRLIINIDGMRTGPIVNNEVNNNKGLVTLTPIDTEAFKRPPWKDRNVRLGFCGSWEIGHPRADFIPLYSKIGLLTAINRVLPSYESYATFMDSCRCVFNDALSTTIPQMHVKGRVLEAAAAGCLLFENVDSPTQDWFVPNEDYLTYRDLGDLADKLNWVDKNLDAAESIAAGMSKKVIEQHSAQVFWPRVLQQAGIS